MLDRSRLLAPLREYDLEYLLAWTKHHPRLHVQKRLCGTHVETIEPPFDACQRKMNMDWQRILSYILGTAQERPEMLDR